MSKKIVHVVTVLDGSTEETIEVFRLPGFELASFRAQFDVPVETDPEMLDRYAVGPDDLPFLTPTIEGSPHFDFTRNAYFIEAVEDDL